MDNNIIRASMDKLRKKAQELVVPKPYTRKQINDFNNSRAGRAVRSGLTEYARPLNNYALNLGAAGAGLLQEATRPLITSDLLSPEQQKSVYDFNIGLGERAQAARQIAGTEGSLTGGNAAKTAMRGLGTTANTALTLAGTARMAANPLLAGTATGLAGTIGGGGALLSGQDPLEGAGRAIGRTPRIVGLTTNITDPVTQNVAGLAKGQISSNVGRQIVGRSITGAGNVIEDEILQALEGVPQTTADRVLSFALGFALSSGSNPQDFNTFKKNFSEQFGGVLKPKQIDQVTEAVKDRPTGRIVYNATDSKLNADTAGLSELGKGKYFALNEGTARVYGDNIEGLELSPSAKMLDLSNPATYQEFGDKAFIRYGRDLMKPGMSPEEVQGQALTRFAKELGYDGMLTDKIGIVFEPEKTLKQVSDRVLEAARMVEADANSPNIGFKTKAVDTKTDSANVGKAVDTREYLQEQIQKQSQDTASKNLDEKLKSGSRWVRTKFVDFTTPITDVLEDVEKVNESSFRILPHSDIRYQIDRVLRSHSIAGQYIKDTGMDKLIQSIYDDEDTYKMFNQYLIAKQAVRVAEEGFETGRNLDADKQVVEELAPKFAELEPVIRNFSDGLLDYSVKAGLVSEDLATLLRQKYPDYVPLNRVFSETELENIRAFGKGGPASIGSQNVIKRLQGSERAIKDPTESLLSSAVLAFSEGERNIAARQLISYKDLPGNPFALRKLKSSEKTTGKAVVNALIDGKKVTYETHPDIAEAAKNLDREQLNMLGKVLAVPTRVLKVGAVGLNVPFILSNLVRDQSFSAVVSGKGLIDSVSHPVTFVKTFYSVMNQDDLYDDWVRSGSSFTSFDISRTQAKQGIEEIAAKSGDLPSRISKTVTNPKQLLRAVEDIVGKTEEVSRVQTFRAVRDDLLNQGRSIQDANILAADASRFGTANFSRYGTYGRVLNGVIPFFNAGIQGARSLVRSFKDAPKETSARFAATIGLPVVLATIWNNSDPSRKAAYDDIQEFEKENNLIILAPNPSRDERGRWQAIKIPVTPGMSNLMSVIRRQVEGTQQYNMAGFRQLANDVLSATTSIPAFDQRQLLSSAVPQAVKPSVEAATNTNLFTGRNIVPFYMKDLPPEDQVFDNTSGSARILGRVTNTSPLVVENTISTSLGGVGRQITNAADQALYRLGLIPSNQIGGESAASNIRRRFSLASGGKLADEIEEQAQTYSNEKRRLNNQIKAAYLRGEDLTQYLGSAVDKSQLRSLVRSAEDRALKDSLTQEERAIMNLSADQRARLLDARPELSDLVRKVELIESGQVGAGSASLSTYAYMTDVAEVLNMPNKTRFDALKRKEASYSAASKVLKDNLVPAEAKIQLIQSMGISAENIGYYEIAKENNDLKLAYIADNMESIASQTKDRGEFLKWLARQRKEVNDEMILTDRLVDELEDMGAITKNEAEILKGGYINEDGSVQVKVTGRGRGARIKKVEFVPLTMPSRSGMASNLLSLENQAKITF